MDENSRTIDENIFISHLYQKEENGEWVIQTNDEHQNGVARFAAEFSGKFGLPAWGDTLGHLHDKGKEKTCGNPVFEVYC